MGTAGRMARAQEAVQKASTLAEAQAILEKLVEEEQEVADVFYTQQQQIESLQEILRRKEELPVYVPPVQPAPKRPNYLLFIAIGILLFLLFRRNKLL